MANTILTFHADALEHTLPEICRFLEEHMVRYSAEPVARRAAEFMDGCVVELIFEKFFLRTGSYAGLTIFLSENDSGLDAQIAGFSGGSGLLNCSLWANDDLAEEAAAVLEKAGFIRENAES